MIRRVPLRVRVGEDWLPPLDVELHRVVRAAGVRAAPLPGDASTLINFRGPAQTFPWIAYYRVLNGEVPPEVFRDKVVYLGPTSEIFHDLFATAYAPAGDMPGVEIHANTLDMLVRGDRIREIPVPLTAALAAVTALIGAWLVARIHALRALLVAMLVSTVVAASAFYEEYGVPIIISESTYELVKGQFPTRELGAVTVKGKTQPVKIYAVLCEEGAGAAPETRAGVAA